MVVKLGVVGIFIVLGANFLFHHPALATANWHPFIPPPDGHGNFGIGGITAARPSSSSPTSASTPSPPPRRKPRTRSATCPSASSARWSSAPSSTSSSPASSLAWSSITALNVAAPVAVGIDVTGIGWGSILVKIGAVFGLGTVMLVMLLGQSRVFYSMSSDGLLWKWAGDIHPKFRTPWISNIVVGGIVAIMPAVLNIDNLSELVNMGTLLAFAIVCAGVWILRRRYPDLHRPFKTPLVPLVPILGIASALFLVWKLPTLTKVVVFIWLLFGFIIYFTYSIKHSKVQKDTAAGTNV